MFRFIWLVVYLEIVHFTLSFILMIAQQSAFFQLRRITGDYYLIDFVEICSVVAISQLQMFSLWKSIFFSKLPITLVDKLGVVTFWIGIYGLFGEAIDIFTYFNGDSQQMMDFAFSAKAVIATAMLLVSLFAPYWPLEVSKRFQVECPSQWSE